MSQAIRVSRLYFAAWIDTASWRALALARSLQVRSPWAARQLRRAVLLLWWTATFQLHIHLRHWLRARRLRRVAPAPIPVPIAEAVDPRCLYLPFDREPLVSVIIPTYGQVAFTLRCLASIGNHRPTLPIEVIVVDDAWKGLDAAALDLVHGIRLIRNPTNLGFLRSCNKAAVEAKGRYLLFLNNDTEVLDDWLAPMVALFRQRPATGAVGAKLLYPDGRLQEAGGIVWQDASAWNFGRLEDASNPLYNYVREVDYCSGAALMVEQSTFARLAGFDETYAPAYFEDADLSFRLREIGLNTLYQPRSMVIHHEGVSHGRDIDAGIKSYQAVNRRKFVRRWRKVLAAGHYANGQNVFRARDRAMHRSVVLVVDHYVPTPDRDAGSRTMMAFLDALLQAGFVVKFWPHNLGYNPGYTEALQGMGIEVLYGPFQPGFEAWIKAAGSDIDAVLVSRPDVAEDVIPAIRRHCKARIVYYGHDLHFRRMRQQAKLTGDDRLRRAADHMRERECAIWQQADLSLYPSQEEHRIACSLEPDARIGAIVPYFFDRFPSPRQPPAGQEILFVAGFGHPPNEDAAAWFATDILPLIRSAIPRACLSIVGSNPTARVQALAGDDIAVLANVSEADLAAAYDRARVAVVPLRCGAGVKLKVVEALRSGIPLVTTPVGAQGLPGLSAVVAVEQEPRAFAAAIIALMRNHAAWEAQSRAQVDYARERFSREALTRSLLAALGLPMERDRRAPTPSDAKERQTTSGLV